MGMSEILQIVVTSLAVAIFVLCDMSIPKDVIRLDRSAFYLFWPPGEIVARMYCREFHIVFCGFEYHLLLLDDVKTVSQRWLGKS